MAASGPSTTRIERMASRYSVAQSFSLASPILASMACAAASPRSAQPASTRSSTMPGSCRAAMPRRSEEHTSELQSLMRISYAVFCLKKKKITLTNEYKDYHNTYARKYEQSTVVQSE